MEIEGSFAEDKGNIFEGLIKTPNVELIVKNRDTLTQF